MIYIFEGGSVVYDGDTISEEEKSKAILVTERPVKEQIEDKTSVLKWDVETQTAWYEYVDAPETDLEKLNQKLELQQVLLDDLLINIIPMLMMGGEM